MIVRVKFNEKVHTKLNDGLAALSDEGNGDADAVTQEDERQDDDDNRDSQSDEKDEPCLSKRQISLKVCRKGDLRQALIGTVHIGQFLEARETIPHSCRKE